MLATLGFLAFDAAACDSFLLLAQVFGIFIMVLPPGIAVETAITVMTVVTVIVAMVSICARTSRFRVGIAWLCSLVVGNEVADPHNCPGNHSRNPFLHAFQ